MRIILKNSNKMEKIAKSSHIMFTKRKKSGIMVILRGYKGEMKTMKIIKKSMTILIAFCVLLMILSSNVNAASTSISTSASKVTVGKSVSITVNFGEKVSAAQFVLDFDTSKFEYVSNSLGGTYSKDTKRFAWVDGGASNSASSVRFTFKANALGSGSFNISKLVLSNEANNISKSSITVTVQKASATNTNTNNNKKPTPTPTDAPNTSEEFSKLELSILENEMYDLIETDYTEESWKKLQEALEKARNATNVAEYDEVKALLTIDTLEIEKFEKTELNQLLRDLMGKSQENYTEESWQELQDAIELADEAELKSEYDEIKDKLTIDTLIESEKSFFDPVINFFEGLDEQQRISLALGVCVFILLIILIIVFIMYKKEKKRTRIDARRLK